MAPFTHIQINAAGEINPCCMFNERVYNKEYDSLTDAFKGEENLNLRQRMMNDEKIEGCGKCYRDESLSKKSYRQLFNERYGEEYILNPKIKELEIALGNKCNFKCVDCNTRFSSAWYEEDILLGRTYYTNKGRELKNDITNIDFDLLELKQLKVLGGEPFLDKRYLELFDRLKNPEEIELFFVTNNSIFPNDTWLEYFKKFKCINFNISIDGVYEIAEFVRYGTKFFKFENNYKRWLDLSLPNMTVIPHFVFHNLNILNFIDTIDWLCEIYQQNIEWIMDLLSYDFLEQPDYLNCSLLHDYTKQHICDEYEGHPFWPNITEFLHSKKYDENVYENFIRYLNFLRTRSDIPKQSLDLFQYEY